MELLSVNIGQSQTMQRDNRDLRPREVFRLYFEKSPSPAAIARVLNSPMAIRGRRAYEAMLDS